MSDTRAGSYYSMTFRWGIRSKVLLMALTPPTLIAMCLGFYLVQTRIGSLEDSLVERGRTIANQMAPASEFGVMNAKYDLLQDLADAALGEKDVKTVTITDISGRLLAQTRRRAPSSLQDEILTRLLKFFIRDDIPLTFQAPIRRPSIEGSNADGATGESGEQSDDENLLGWVTVELTLSGTNEKQGQALVDSALITLFTIIASALVGLWASRTVTEPIMRMTEAVQNLERGRLDTRIEEHSGGELGTLEHGINSMAQSLQRGHEELQEKVETATAELRETLEAVEIQNVELDIARKKALEGSRVKSEFLANMSHEIRTPINGILGFVDLLSHTHLDDEQRDHINTIKESSANLLAIINDILDFSKIEAGKLVIDNVAFDLRDCVEEVFSLLAPAAYAKSLELVHLIYSDVPLKLQGDPIRIRQVLTNLVHNAIKFTPSGRVVVRVMQDEEGGDEVLMRISVADTGIGLQEEDQKKLFNAFSQADTSTTRRFGGAGLGLVISKKLVEQMGGTIGLDSEPDKGSTFWFTLRLRKQRVRDASEEKEQTPLTGKKLLLLDEQPLSRLALRHIFESWEMDVTEVDNQQTFINLLAQEENWDVALLGLARNEVNSRNLHGLMGRIRNQEVPLAVLANTVDRSELRSLYQQGALVSLPKSTRRQTLYRELCRLMAPESAAALATYEEQRTGVAIKSIPGGQHDNNDDAVFKDKGNYPLHVLVVDDNKINRKLATTLLRKHGASVSEAENGQQAVVRATSEHFDIILMDIHMPIMNGEDATIKIRELHQDNTPPPIIALTANAMPGEKDRLIQAGMDDCLIKPISEEQIISILKEYRNNPAREDYELSDPLPYEAKDSEEGADTTPNTKKKLSSTNRLAQELLEMLQAELPIHRDAIQVAFQEGDLTVLKDAVHKLHGAASVCGVPPLKEACHTLETLLMSGAQSGLEEHYASLLTAIDDLSPA